MKLNCRLGDLAWIVRSAAGNEGKIVRCVRFAGVRTHIGRDGLETPSEPCWEIDPPMRGWRGALTDYMQDSKLRPLRGSNGEDAMLRIAGKPVDVTSAQQKEPTA